MTESAHHKEAYKQVLEILNLEEGLSDWEVGFAEDIVRKLEAGGLLTDKQLDTINKIHEEKVNR